MMEFEDQLRNALARKQPPVGFAKRMAVRAARRSPRRNVLRAWVAGCLAASLLAGAFGLKQFEDRRRYEQGQAARAQLLRAVAITSNKLQHIQKRVEMIEQ